MTLTAKALGPMNATKQIGLVLAGTLLLTAASQISVPFFPVPMTLQTLAVLFVGFAMGSRLGALTVLAWLGQAALGAPVLSNFGNAAAFAGPTAGFLLGFVGMAWLAGLATDRGLTGPVKLSAVALAASALLYLPGLAWPLGVAQLAGIEAGWAGLTFDKVVAGFMLPFLLGDAVKAVLAALIVSGGMRMLSKRDA